MNINTFSFVTELLQFLKVEHVRSWVSGGWAEEIWGLIAPRPHHDVDLLYPGLDFFILDQFIQRTTNISEIRAKRFSHKRAIIYQNVMIEWLLLQPSQSGYVTHFFDGRYVFYWPEASLSQIKDPTEDYLDIASRDALIAYGQSGDARNHAYQAYLAQKETM